MSAHPYRAGLLGRLLSALSVLCLFVAWIAALEASAESVKARYEREISLKLLAREGWTLEPKPEGKRVRAIHTIRLPVFLEGEGGGWLAKLNALHVTTRSKVILRESRVARGAPFKQQDALETERNLRGTGLFTFVQVFAVKTRTRAVSGGAEKPEMIELVVVTRDLWSLRLESSFEYVGGGANSLALNLTERNLLGQRQSLSLQSLLSPFTVTTGLSISDPRFGPDLSAGGNAGVIWGRESGAREGLYAGVGLSRPLYNQDQAWSLSSSAQAIERLSRLTRGAEVLRDEPLEVGEEPLPIEWTTRSYSASIGATRQWSGALQQRVGVSIGGGVTEYLLSAQLSEARAARWRRDYLAPDRAQLGPALSYRVYQRRFTALSDVSTYGLSEDLQLGASLSASLSASVFGDQALTPSAQAQWTARWGGRGARAGFWKLSVGGRARRQPDESLLEGSGEWVNRSLTTQLSGSSPNWSAIQGRVVWSAFASGLWGDVNNSVVSLGGSQGLRGYAAQALFAQSAHVARANIEYRSAPWAWSFVHIGGALFYDAGVVGRALEGAQAGQGAGLGLRLLFPQLNRSVFRFDVGAPLHDPSAAQISVTSSQAFALMPWEVIL